MKVNHKGEEVWLAKVAAGFLLALAPIRADAVTRS